MTQPLDERAADRVLMRASELAGLTAPLPRDGVEPEHLVTVADEVGIPADAVRRSLAIEQLGPAPRRRRLDGVAGPSHVVEERVVPGSPDEVLGRIDGVLTAGTHARGKSVAGRSREWVRRDELVPTIRRSRRVHAAACPLGGSTAAVQVRVDRRRNRWAALGWGGLAGTALTLTLAVSVVAPPVALVALPVAAAGALPLSRSRAEAERVARELASLLDTFDGGERQPVR